MSLLNVCIQINARYDANAEAEVISWFRQLCNTHIEPGMHHVEKALKSGVELLRLHSQFASANLFNESSVSNNLLVNQFSTYTIITVYLI